MCDFVVVVGYRLERKPYMPYKVWEDKVRMRLRQWYKAYKDSGKDAKKVVLMWANRWIDR